jgi:hypothetical protein
MQGDGWERLGMTVEGMEVGDTVCLVMLGRETVSPLPQRSLHDTILHDTATPCISPERFPSRHESRACMFINAVPSAMLYNASSRLQS